MTGETIRFGGKSYLVKKLIGKGKSAYSYLIINDFDRLVLKAIHDEPCPYYEFQDKLNAELAAYKQLVQIGINVPELIGVDEEKKWIIKDFIHGNTAAQLVSMNRMGDDQLKQLSEMAKTASKAGLNLDYFPTNFVWGCKKMYYIDYEINPYHENWNIRNWGLYYWVNVEGMRKYLETGDASGINADQNKGIPVKEPFEAEVNQLIQKFSIDS